MDKLVKTCKEKPGARLAWAEHPAEGATPRHFHFVADFSNPVRLKDALTYLCEVDPHNYVKPCRTFKGCVRYLAHLDDPDKCHLDPSIINVGGDWEGTDLRKWLIRSGVNMSRALLLHKLASYLEETSGEQFRPLRFAIWLDSHGYDSDKVFASLRRMGISWEELINETYDKDFLGSVPSGDSPPPPADVEGGTSSDGIGRAS